MYHLRTYSRFWTLTALVVVLFLIAFVVIKEIRINNLLNIEFSDSFNEFKALVTKGNRTIKVLKYNTYVDFGFIISYTLLFFMSVKVFDFTLGLRFSKWYYLICFLPGVLDIFENITFLSMLNNLNSNVTNTFICFFWSVRLKWGFVIPFLIITFTIILFYGTLWGTTLINRLMSFK